MVAGMHVVLCVRVVLLIYPPRLVGVDLGVTMDCRVPCAPLHAECMQSTCWVQVERMLAELPLSHCDERVQEMLHEMNAAGARAP